MKYLLNIILLVFAMAGEAQIYQRISPFAEDVPIKGDFVSPSQGWAFKYNADELYSEDLYFTDDGGDSWAMIYSLDYIWEKFRDIQMIDSQFGMATIYLAGVDYRDYRLTFDGGYTWTSIIDTLPDGLEIQYIQFISSETGFVCTQPLVAHESISIYKTVDSGLTWTHSENPDNASAMQNIMYSLDETHIWSGGYLYPTIDGGGLHYSNDGGDSWNLIATTQPIYDIEMVTPDYGAYVGIHYSAQYNSLVITHDNFNTYTYLYEHFDFMDFFFGFCFQNESNIWVACRMGKLMLSLNGGASFHEYVNLNDDLQDIEFFNDTGYVYGVDSIYKLNYPVSNNDSEQISADDYQLTNYPNPFNPQTTISFALEKTENVKLEIFNPKGQRVKTLLKSRLQPGIHNYVWDGTDCQDKKVSSGVYLYRLEVAGEKNIKQCILLK